MELRDFYQTHFFHEIDRRDQINSSLAFPLGIVSVVSGALLVLAREIDFPFDDTEVFQLIFLGITVVALVLAVIHLARAYWGYGYAYMPRMKEIGQYCQDLELYYHGLNYDDEAAKKMAREDTLAYIEHEYSSNSELNAANNDIKSANLFKANGLTMLSVVFLVISAVPYLIRVIAEPSEVQKIQITNLKELNMANSNLLPQKPDTQQKSPPTSAPVPPPKPTPPPSRIIREHIEPTFKK